MNQYDVMTELHASNCEIEQEVNIIDNIITNAGKIFQSLQRALLFMFRTIMNQLEAQAALLEKLHKSYFAERDKFRHMEKDIVEDKPCKN